jgi:hypothetical protein
VLTISRGRKKKGNNGKYGRGEGVEERTGEIAFTCSQDSPFKRK